MDDTIMSWEKFLTTSNDYYSRVISDVPIKTEENFSWYVSVSDEATSEAIQRIAFSFGYEWPHIGKVVYFKNQKYLIFNSKFRIISFCDFLDRKDVVVYNTFDDICWSFKNLNGNKPPKLCSNGNVIVGDKIFTKEEFDTLTSRRNNMEGLFSRKYFSIIRFKYDFKSNGIALYKKILVCFDGQYGIAGYDMEHSYKPVYFSKDQIIDGITYIGMGCKPN